MTISRESSPILQQDTYWTITTPHGFQIWLPPQYSFILLSRLESHLKPFEFLELVEGAYCLRILCSNLVAGVAMFFSGSPLLVGGLYLAISVIFPFSVDRLELPFSLLRLSERVGSGLLGSYFIPLALAVMTYTLHGWLLLITFVTLHFGSHFVYHTADSWNMIRLRRTFGFAIGPIERMFIAVYRNAARKFGLDQSTQIRGFEVKEKRWMDPYSVFSAEWPALLERRVNISGNFEKVCPLLVNYGISDEYR